jgi:hypothetical protein
LGYVPHQAKTECALPKNSPPESSVPYSSASVGSCGFLPRPVHYVQLMIHSSIYLYGECKPIPWQRRKWNVPKASCWPAFKERKQREGKKNAREQESVVIVFSEPDVLEYARNQKRKPKTLYEGKPKAPNGRPLSPPVGRSRNLCRREISLTLRLPMRHTPRQKRSVAPQVPGFPNGANRLSNRFSQTILIDIGKND